MKKKLVLFFSILCLISTAFFSYKVIRWKLDSIENKKIIKKIEENINVVEESNKVIYNIDFDSLKKDNLDVVAYIKVNNTKIDYVVVKAHDNDYYLKHNYNRNYNEAGWIFADYHNKFDETDKNIVIYGHNKKDGTMFGTMRNILKKEWYQNEDNHKIVLVTENKTYYYQVFSIYTIKVEDYYINTIFNDNEFDNFIKTLKLRSIYNFNLDVSGDDKILTLSTCIYGNDRLVLHAKLIN